MLTGFIHLISELEKTDEVKADISKTEVNPICPLMFPWQPYFERHVFRNLGFIHFLLLCFV